ncbi:MAG: hypothetical protein J7J31_06280 [Helicobacteraceae bacterium]|nr:hypothetical protein [Helicobacteraceae bacterium]
MIKIVLLSIFFLFLTGCVNKHGISAKYYSDCEEYYDLQGYYHKKCGEDNIVTYEDISKQTDNAIRYTDDAIRYIKGEESDKEKGQKNVW